MHVGAFQVSILDKFEFLPQYVFGGARVDYLGLCVQDRTNTLAIAYYCCDQHNYAGNGDKARERARKLGFSIYLEEILEARTN